MNIPSWSVTTEAQDTSQSKEPNLVSNRTTFNLHRLHKRRKRCQWRARSLCLSGTSEIAGQALNSAIPASLVRVFVAPITRGCPYGLFHKLLGEPSAKAQSLSLAGAGQERTLVETRSDLFVGSATEAKALYSQIGGTYGSITAIFSSIAGFAAFREQPKKAS